MPALLFPTRGHPFYNAVAAAHELQYLHGWELIVRAGRHFLECIRGALASAALATEHEWFVWLDDDHDVRPKQLITLLERAQRIEAPILGSICHPRPLVGETVDRCLTSYVPRNVTPHQGILRVDWVGFGLVVTHRRVFEHTPHRLIKSAMGEHGDWFLGEVDGDEYQTDDVAFAARARRAGFEVRCDTDTYIRHAGLPGDLPT